MATVQDTSADRRPASIAKEPHYRSGFSCGAATCARGKPASQEQPARQIVWAFDRLGRGLKHLLLALLTCCSAVATGQQFSPDGFDADSYGRRDGYPPCTAATYIAEQRCRVGALSHFDTLFPARVVRAPAVAAPLRRTPAEPEIRGLQRYLASWPVTGLLVARGDSILLERYQYGRNDRHRMTSFSMAKTVTGLLVGTALADGHIASLDDPAERYVPQLAGTEYGRTSLRNLLRMSSGVAFRETYTDRSSDIYVLAQGTLMQGAGGAVEALKKFNTREAPAGARFSYSSAESTVLGLVVIGATGQPLADYMSSKLWQPLGAEADASWNIDSTGKEIGYAYVNATLRDWARLGLMLAHGGRWNGQQIITQGYLSEATSTADGRLGPGYGYQIWLLATARPTFALRGLRGQWVLVDPQSKLVVVQTAARLGSDEVMDEELLAIWRELLTRHSDRE